MSPVLSEDESLHLHSFANYRVILDGQRATIGTEDSLQEGLSWRKANREERASRGTTYVHGERSHGG